MKTPTFPDIPDFDAPKPVLYDGLGVFDNNPADPLLPHKVSSTVTQYHPGFQRTQIPSKRRRQAAGLGKSGDGITFAKWEEINNSRVRRCFVRNTVQPSVAAAMIKASEMLLVKAQHGIGNPGGDDDILDHD